MATCACGSPLDYRQCCRPLHRGEAEADSPSRLVRARFCAFAQKEPGYLWRTLHSRHADRARPEEEVLRALRASAQHYRYVRLHLLGARGDEVLFLAELYERGKERSFVERSRFAQEDGAWRYLDGVNAPARAAEAEHWSWERLPVKAADAPQSPES